MMKEKRFEVDDLDNKGYEKESKFGKALKTAAGVLFIVGSVFAGVVKVRSQKDEISKDK